jgi:hypothetical protein
MRLQILDHAHGGERAKTLEFSCPLNGGWYRSPFHSLVAPFGEEPFCRHGEQIQSFDLERASVVFRLLGQMRCKPAAAPSRIDRKRPEKPESPEDLHPHDSSDLSFFLQNQEMAETFRGNVLLG